MNARGISGQESGRTFSAYYERMEYLRRQASLEGYSINSVSERAFWNCCASVPRIRRGGLVLLDNGNLRAVWKGENEAHVGLQFLEEQSVQYVIFVRRQSALSVSRVCGRDTVEGVRRQMEAFDIGCVLSQ